MLVYPPPSYTSFYSSIHTIYNWFASLNSSGRRKKDLQMQSIKETAANVAATAKSGMEKTKATVEEKMERMTAHNRTEKEMATERKEARIHDAELKKLEAREHNAAARMTGQPIGGHLPGHGAGSHATEGMIKAHPVGTAAEHHTHVGGGAGTGYGTGGGYSG